MTSRIRRNSLVPPAVQPPIIEEPQPRERRKSVSFFTSPSTPEPRSQPIIPQTAPAPVPTPVSVPAPVPVKEGMKSLSDRVTRNEKRLDDVKPCQCHTVEARFKNDIEQLKKAHDVAIKKLSEELALLQRELREVIDS